MIDSRQLRELVVRPALRHVQLWTPAAEELLLGTAAQESRGGQYLHQLGAGPALGIFQVEPATHDDIWTHYLYGRDALRERVLDLVARTAPPELTSSLVRGREGLAGQMVWNLAYAAAMARLVYRRAPAPLPTAGDVPALARYWKRWYNTPKGKGTPEEFEANYRRFVSA